MREIVAHSNGSLGEGGILLAKERDQALRELSLVEDKIKNIIDFIGGGRGNQQSWGTQWRHPRGSIGSESSVSA